MITDALAEDNHAQLEVPAQPAVRVLVYSEEPDLLRPFCAPIPTWRPSSPIPATTIPRPMPES